MVERKSPLRASPRPAPHLAVAERFRFFLEAAGISRQELVDAVGGAIGARSLFSVLSGDRKPSRALALLIEGTWGFRAEYLLHGAGEPWLPARAVRKADLTPLERDVLAFMRSSPDNARAIENALDMARLWSRLFARTLAMLREVDACATDGADADASGALYPAFAKLAYEDCQFSARKFAQLIELAHVRRVFRLTDRFLVRYLGELPRAALPPADAEALAAIVEPILARRRERLAVLDASIAALRATLETLAEMGSPRPMLIERSSYRRTRERQEAVELLERVAREALPARAWADVRAALAALRRAERAEPRLGALLRRLARDLSRELEMAVPMISRESAEELRALHEKIVEPLVV